MQIIWQILLTQPAAIRSTTIVSQDVLWLFASVVRLLKAASTCRSIQGSLCWPTKSWAVFESVPEVLFTTETPQRCRSCVLQFSRHCHSRGRKLQTCFSILGFLTWQSWNAVRRRWPTNPLMMPGESSCGRDFLPVCS